MKLRSNPIAWAELVCTGLLAAVVFLLGAVLLADAVLAIVSAETMEQDLHPSRSGPGDHWGRSAAKSPGNSAGSR
jgi:hypothetical protein